ncbi:metal ABC transporter permease, partial [Simkania negevensis]|nr:metal ABC transporter permease [Simkania negevensis]
MSSLIDLLRNNTLLLFALMAGLLASVTSGVVGSYVVVKRLAFISGSISHAVLSG